MNNLLGVLVNRETKRNGSRALNNYKFAHLSATRLTTVHTATSGPFVSSSIVNQVRLYKAVYVLLLL